LLLFPITIVEGPIITIIAGFLASLKILEFFTTYAIVVIGDLVGDALYYILGRYGRSGFLDKWGKYIGLTAGNLQKVEGHFNDHGGKTLLFGKLSHGVGAAILTAAGMGNMRFGKFIFFNAAGTLPKSLLLMLAGYYFGSAVTHINSMLELLGAIVLCAAIIGFTGYYFYYRRFPNGK
jgi:membrane protein DedA with SNARE-associated domain